MSGTSPNSSSPEAAARLPLFYRDAQLLSSIDHASWRLKRGDASFASAAPAVPIVVGEFQAALRNFPILFAQGGSEVGPIALLGLEQANLFVKDGKWAEGAYVPAYVRRYPFGFMAHPQGFALAIDVASERVAKGGEEGDALFTGGEPSNVTKQALDFCHAYREEAATTAEFCRALRTQDLLTDRRADATLPSGHKVGIDGFQIVDAQKFAQLDDKHVLEWHRKGWLSLVHFHLASLERFEDLLARRSARDR
ncbi:MAG TPA: SapC family protein [Steroidobacteraceae bacterium]|jgi:hypothetical protein